MKKLAVTCIALSSVALSAETNLGIERDPHQTKVNENYPNHRDTLENDLLRKQVLSEVKDIKKVDNIIRYTGRELVENPEILENLFLEALVSPNKAILPTYIKLYNYVPNADRSLIEWANAILQRDENLNRSVKSYRALSANFPDNNFIRYQLAETLFYNQEYEAAKNQFEKLRASSGVTEQDIKVFDQYIEAIGSKENWNFSFGATFLNDKNLANSAKEGTTMESDSGSFTAGKRQAGKGISAWLGANKQWSLAGGKYILFDSNISSKYYWDNKNYNDMNGYLGLGIGYSDARLNISFIPSIQKRWYAGGSNSSQSLKQYSNTYGGALSLGYWLNQNFKYSSYYSFGYDKYDRKVYSAQYNGASHFLTNSLMYFPSATQYWSLALDLSKKYATDKTNAYNRIGSRLTWGQEWWSGLTTSTTLGVAKRYYKQKSFFGSKQKNTEYSASISLWHKKVHYAGFTPRITWSYTKTNSNIPIYAYDKNQVFFEVSRSF